MSQDIIITTDGEEIKAKVKEVTELAVSYFKFDNQSGPLYTKSIANIFQIKYENGSIELYNKNAVTLDETLIKISRESPLELTKKGKSVFIEIPDEASRAGEKYFIEALKEWGYWNIVKDVREAHFILVFNIDKKAMLDKSATLTFRTRENQEFKKSEPYRASTNAFNGYNAFRGVANKIVEKYLKKEFN